MQKDPDSVTPLLTRYIGSAQPASEELAPTCAFPECVRGNTEVTALRHSWREREEEAQVCFAGAGQISHQDRGNFVLNCLTQRPDHSPDQFSVEGDTVMGVLSPVKQGAPCGLSDTVNVDWRGYKSCVDDSELGWVYHRGSTTSIPKADKEEQGS